MLASRSGIDTYGAREWFSAGAGRSCVSDRAGVAACGGLVTRTDDALRSARSDNVGLVQQTASGSQLGLIGGVANAAALDAFTERCT